MLSNTSELHLGNKHTICRDEIRSCFLLPTVLRAGRDAFFSQCPKDWRSEMRLVIEEGQDRDKARYESTMVEYFYLS